MQFVTTLEDLLNVYVPLERLEMLIHKVAVSLSQNVKPMQIVRKRHDVSENQEALNVPLCAKMLNVALMQNVALEDPKVFVCVGKIMKEIQKI